MIDTSRRILPSRIALMPEITLVPIATFDDPHLAHIARSRLESEDVRAVIDGEHHVAMDWMITNAVGGVKLLVRSSDQVAAARILNEVTSVAGVDSGQNVGSNEGRIRHCPSCGSQETFRERLKRKWIFLSLLLLSIPIPFLSRKIVCESCENRWVPQ